MRKVLLTIGAAALLLQASMFAAIQSDTGPTYRLTGTRIAIGQDVRIERDEEVTDAVVVLGGSATVEGRVRDGIVVVGGDLHLLPTADVRGDVVLVGGRLTRDPGAQLVGGVDYISFDNWSLRNFGWWPSIRFGEFGEFGRWLTLAGTLARVSLLAVLIAMTLIVARAPVARVGRAALAEPLRAFVIGLAAEVLFLPLLIAASIGLALTIIGIPLVAVLVPIAFVIAVFAFVLGFTAFTCRLGEWIEDRLGWQPGNALVASAIGFIVLLAPTLLARIIALSVPGLTVLPLALIVVGMTIEFVAWTIGLGATIVTGFGRWYTVPPPITAQPADPIAPANAF